MNRDGGKKTTIQQSRKTQFAKILLICTTMTQFACVTIQLQPAANGHTRKPSDASPRHAQARACVPSVAAARSIVICPFIDLSAKRLLLENRHGKNGSPNKTKGGHRTGKKRSTKELETVQTIRKKVVLESRKIRPRQRRGFFIDNFPDRQSRIQRFAASSISHALATSAAG
jgi:hypothetical protein